MYQRIKSLSSTRNEASGPDIDAETFFSDPVLQDDCIAYLTTLPRREYSRYVSELLDLLGYSYDMIKYRQHILDETDKLDNRHGSLPFKRVITGGKGEGIALYYESDADFMNIVKDIICADYPQNLIYSENDTLSTLFQTERQETSPGYTTLRLLRFKGQCFVNEIGQSLFKSETVSQYLSSHCFTNAIQNNARTNPRLGQKFTLGDTSGPSTPFFNKYGKIDKVTCFRCFCPDILQRWVSRPRCHGWPSQDTIHEIYLLDGHVVPVGLKGSQTMYKEWRICYSLAELHLMRNFNEIQLKVYILLKKISKSVLNPVCEEITSYIMKNVVFWMCEANGIGRFTKDLLMDRLFDCIKYLRTCVCENNLPSYMIPERNLLAGRLDIQQRQQLTCLLSDLLHEGGRMFMRCDKLRDATLAIYKTPDMFREFGEKRDKIESMVLMLDKTSAELRRPGMSPEKTRRLLAQNKQYCDIQTRINHLMLFDVHAQRQIGKTDEEIQDLWSARMSLLLS